MSNSNLFRIAGYGAILSPVLWIVALGVGALNPALTSPLLVVASIIFLPAVYALFVVHRAESFGLALSAALLTAIGLIVGTFAGDPSVPANAPLYGGSSIIMGAGIVLFGWLAYKSTKMPRGLAIAALITGVLTLLGGITYLAGIGTTALGNLLNYGLIIPYIVWMIWLGRHFLSGKLATA
jgi:hypothetical protein